MRLRKDGGFPAVKPTRTKKGGLIKALVYLAVMLCACLGAMELILHLAFPVRSQERLTWSQNIPGVKKKVVYEVNRFGLRSRTVETIKPPPSTCRILCLGASTIEQMTKNHEDTWPEILRQRLQREFDPLGLRIEMGAYGLGGRRALDRLAWVKSGLPVTPPVEPLDLEPDILIFLEGVNDMTLGGGPEDKGSSPQEKLARKMSEGSGGLKGLALKHSQLALRLRLLYHKIYIEWLVSKGLAEDWGGDNLERLMAAYQKMPFVEAPQRSVDPIIEFRYAVEGILTTLQGAGVEPVLLGQPVLWKENMSQAEKAAQWMGINTTQGFVKSSGAWCLREARRFNQAQAELAAAHGATYLDLDPEIPKNLDYYIDHCHYTDRGSARVAELVFPVIRGKIAEMEKAGRFRK